jgi:hypothetical protein
MDKLFGSLVIQVWVLKMVFQVRKLHSDVSDRAAIVKTARAICELIKELWQINCKKVKINYIINP